ncbi:MAG TPA: hypothetical protein VEN81_12650 [Planctomycetota bacterium]|jgi:hypothetical protein|nr:hypothetical protein [Planctomycetota bacterium]
MTKEGAVKGTIGLSLLAGFLWVCLFLYWHFKILGAITTLMNQTTPPKPGSAQNKVNYAAPDEPIGEIEDAGCRALPYLVKSLDAEKNPAYLLLAYDLLRNMTAPPNPQSTAHPQCPDVRLSYEDGPPERKDKIEEIRSWWTLHGKEFHQGWRIWAPRCPRE